MSTGENGQWRVVMASTGLSMFLSRVVVGFGLAVTGCLAYPWLMNWYLGKWAGRLIIDGRQVRYTGDAGGLLVMWLKTWLLSFITLSLYWWLRGRGNFGRYFDAHLSWA